jgi:predicted acylesterase/phospholipase RssA
MNRRPEQIAAVLSGGGAYGAFGIGVLKVLFAGRSPATGYQALDPTIFTGTSVGSFNAAVLAGYKGSNLDAALHLERIWTEKVSSGPGGRPNAIFRIRGDLRDYLDVKSPAHAWSRFTSDTLTVGRYIFNRTANFLAPSQSIETRAIGLLNMDDFIDSSPLHDLLRDIIHTDDIRNSPKHLRIIATNWATGEASVFGNADFEGERGVQAVLASTAIPGVFPPIEVESNACVDGGVVQNTPLSPAIKLGATELHVVYLNPDPQLVPLQGQPNTIDTMLRVYFMMLATKMDEDIETARWINQGLDVIERLKKGLTIGSGEVAKILRVVAQVLDRGDSPFNKVVVHRYSPKKPLGNELGMLNFDRDQVIKMIEEGEHDALTHDCKKMNCALD